MGAFGDFLQARLGGTKYDVSTWRNYKKESIEETEEERTERERLELIDEMKNYVCRYGNSFNGKPISREHFKNEDGSINEKSWSEFKEWLILKNG